MASLELRSNCYRIVFRFRGMKFQHPLKAANEREAQGCLARLEENLRLVERGRLAVPPDADLSTFLISDGRITSKPELPASVLTLKELAERYTETHSNGALEANSLYTVQIHLRHFRRTLGDRFSVACLKQVDLQTHINKRLKDRGIRNRKVSAVTLRKEIGSLRAVWNWAVRAGFLSGSFPDRGLVYPKTEEKPPFQTWEEIDRHLARGTLTAAQEQDLWDGLFLTVPQIQELLDHVKRQPLPPFAYPMFCFAAFTGARRSEMLRCLVTDIDFEGQKILIREKKRTRGRRTNRFVPLPDALARYLRDWLTHHPCGTEIFCQHLVIGKSRVAAISPADSNDIFRRALLASKWDKLRGWHIFRHSFASNCAAKCIDQRLIDAWMGHQTEEMRKRYRHLIPNQERVAILSVFG